MTIKLSFLGGYREQGRSCLVLNLSGDLFIFDVGIKKTFEKGYYGVPPHLDLIDVNRVKAVFISHLHEDHIALAPWLVSKGYSGPIYMTKPTLELGRKHWYKWAEQFERDGRKIYSKEDVDKTISLAKTVEKSVYIGKLEIVFHPSGHAIGSAFMEIIANGHNILYLADIAKDSNVLVNPPVEEKEYNMVIVNASYGDEVLDRASIEKVLTLKVSSTLKKGGVAFIPLTAVGRGQETLIILLKHKNIIGEAPIYAEKSIEEGFNTLLKYKEYLNKDFLERVGKGYFKDVEYFSPDEYRDILKNRPCIVMAPDLMLMKLSRARALNRRIKEVDGVKVEFYPATEHRVVVVLRNSDLSPRISDSDPGTAKEGSPVKTVEPLEDTPQARRTAQVINKLVKLTYNVLKDHPVNMERKEKGLLPGNIIITRGAGMVPRDLVKFTDLYEAKAYIVAEEATVVGAARILGIEGEIPPGSTATLDTDLDSIYSATMKAWDKGYDIVFIHIKGPDIAGHDNNPWGKVEIIERTDEMLGKILDNIPLEETVVALVADHSTPCMVRDHSGDPVPIAIMGPETRVDDVQTYDEFSCARGIINRIRGRDFIKIILNQMSRPPKWGA